ncbi:MAG: threonine/serine dehydratase [Gemmatimonadaceae bacterium]
MTDMPGDAAVRHQIEAADSRIRPYVRETPVERSRALETPSSRVYLKLENVQHTGSFKLRGAFNRLLRLTDEQKAGGVIAASSGNHGAAVAWAADTLGIRAEVFVPEQAAAPKVEAIRRLGAAVTLFGTDGLDTELQARSVAQARGWTYVSPYNDWDVIAGQGTVGSELRRQLPGLQTVFVAVGGGGLIGGIAADLKGHVPGVRIVGCAPEHSQVMLQSVAAGRVLDLPSLPTLSDGTAGGIEPESVTFSLCARLVDRWVTVTEDAIAAEMRHCITVEHTLVEGAAGVAVAAFRQLAPECHGVTAIVLCGANASAQTLRRILST